MSSAYLCAVLLRGRNIDMAGRGEERDMPFRLEISTYDTGSAYGVDGV